MGGTHGGQNLGKNGFTQFATRTFGKGEFDSSTPCAPKLGENKGTNRGKDWCSKEPSASSRRTGREGSKERPPSARTETLVRLLLALSVEVH